MTFSLSSPYDHDNLGCFLNKLTFTNLADPTDPLFRWYSPRYPGTCVQNPQGLVVVTIDNRDYGGLLENSLLTGSQIYVSTNENVENDFAPPLGIVPITIDDPLLVSTFTPSDTSPVQVVEFDFDVASNQLIIHFNNFIVLSSLEINQLTLSRMSDDGLSRVEHTLLNSVPSTTTNQFIMSLCLSLSAEDIGALQTAGICTARNNCWLSAGGGFVVRYDFIDFVPIDTPMAVSVYRRVTQCKLDWCLYMYDINFNEKTEHYFHM